MRVAHGDVHDDGRGHWSVKVTHTLDDGSTEEGCHVMPHDVLEWRAAEYGIDPSDVDTLMDIVLAEPYLTEEEQSTGANLADAATVQEAREAHLARCAKAKLRHRMSTRGKDHKLNKIKQESPINPEAVQLKQELVEHARGQHHEQSRARRQDPEAQRVAHLRALVNDNRTSTRRD